MDEDETDGYIRNGDYEKGIDFDVKNNKYNDNYRNKSSNLEIVDKVFISSLFTDNIQNGYRERCDDFS